MYGWNKTIQELAGLSREEHMSILSDKDTYDKALKTVMDLTQVEKYWDLNGKEINLHDLKTLVRDQAITSYRAAYRETLKRVLDIVGKHWETYCDISDRTSCLSTLENIHNEIEAIKEGE